MVDFSESLTSKPRLARTTSIILAAAATFLIASIISGGGTGSTGRAISATSTTNPLIHSNRKHQGQTPFSSICKQYACDRYFRAHDNQELERFVKAAQPGDMVELMPGTYLPMYGQVGPGKQKSRCDWPMPAIGGVLYNITGAPGKLITVCGSGPGKTILDGGLKNRKTGAGITVAQSRYLRVAGFTVMNALRGLDVQNTSHSEFLHITTNHTWHEGIRLRYWSSHNLVQYCRIMHTGKGSVGNGEGLYVGTAEGATARCRNPTDESSYNILRDNIFGPNITSENMDVKEFTVGGQIINNTWDGTSCMGVHASISWLALKGRDYIVSDNVGRGLAVEGGGIRLLVRWKGQGVNNTVVRNTCYGLIKKSYCVYVDEKAEGQHVLGCGKDSNKYYDSSRRSMLTNDRTCVGKL